MEDEDNTRSPSSSLSRRPSESSLQTARDEDLFSLAATSRPVRASIDHEIWPVPFHTYSATTTPYPLPPSIRAPDTTSTTDVVSQSILSMASPSSSGTGLAFGTSEEQSTSLISPSSEQYDRFRVLLPTHDSGARSKESQVPKPQRSLIQDERRIIPPSSLSWLVSHFVTLGRAEESETDMPPNTLGASSNSKTAPNPFASTLARDALLAYAHRIFKYPFQPLPLVAPILNIAPKAVPSSSPEHPYSTQLLPLLRGMKRLHSRHLPVLLLLGCVHYAVGDYEASILEHTEILNVDPSFVEAISNIGTNFKALGRLQDAEMWWWKAIRIRPSFWDAVYNVLSAHFPPSASFEKDHVNSRAEDTMCLCDFVQSEIVSDEGILKCVIPPSDFPRLQNIFCISGSLRASLGPSSSTACLRDYTTSVNIILSSEGRGEVTLRHLILAACLSSLSLCEAIPPSLSTLAGSRGISLDSIARLDQRLNDIDLLTFVKDCENDILRDLCGVTRIVPAIFLSPTQASHLRSVVFAASRSVPPAMCERNENSGGLVVPALSVTDESLRIASCALLGIAKNLQEDNSNSTLDAAVDGVFLSSPSLILILYYLAYSFHPSPSTCNNTGILLSSIPWTDSVTSRNKKGTDKLAKCFSREFYEEGLQMDEQNPHLLVNMGSLARESGDVDGAVGYYVRAIQAKPDFDVALTNLANAMKDMGRVAESIPYYRRAIEANRTSPLAEATCGLTHALASVCDWRGFGCVNETQMIDHTGYLKDRSSPGPVDNWSVRLASTASEQLSLSCRINRGLVKSIGAKQDWINWIQDAVGFELDSREIFRCSSMLDKYFNTISDCATTNEGAFVLRMIEWFSMALQWRWFFDAYNQTFRLESQQEPLYARVNAEQVTKFRRPQIPQTMSLQVAVSILPFHTFIYPLSPRLIRLIAQRSALRLSHSALTQHWMPVHVFPPPAPQPRLNIGYVSSDYSDHPTAHLMQSVFGLHDRKRFHIFAYSISASDGSLYRDKIASDTESFRDVSSWTTQEIVERIVQDEIHILVNLNGYTKDARNDIFAARPCPVQMSLLGFAGTLGAGWCDYLVCDPIVCPPEMHKCRYCGITNSDERYQLDFNGDFEEPDDTWVYSEKLLYLPHSYLVTDHRHSFSDLGFGSLMKGPDFDNNWANWEGERERLRQHLFPNISRDTIIFANFNQLYKIEPSIFMTWLRILKRVPKSILWLLRFPAEGEQHLLRKARIWAGPEIAERLHFMDVTNKTEYIRRSFAADLFLDTTECNAHTTAADVLWAGVPIITWPKYPHKMCSRVGASAAYATGFGAYMVTDSEEAYEERAVTFAEGGISAPSDLNLLRRSLCQARNDMPLFDTKRWTRNLEKGFERAWETWVRGGGFLHFKTGALEEPYNCNGYIWVQDEQEINTKGSK